MSKITVAVLDLYEGTANQGMRCIRELLESYSDIIDFEEFDVRCEAALPDLNFDIYISSGGPGDPRFGDGIWEVAYYLWLKKVWEYNSDERNKRKKYVFFICHSFQMAYLFQCGQSYRTEVHVLRYFSGLHDTGWREGIVFQKP